MGHDICYSPFSLVFLASKKLTQPVLKMTGSDLKEDNGYYHSRDYYKGDNNHNRDNNHNGDDKCNGTIVTTTIPNTNSTAQQ